MIETQSRTKISMPYIFNTLPEMLIDLQTLLIVQNSEWYMCNIFKQENSRFLIK